jgi:molybdopterin converting factor small subunit
MVTVRLFAAAAEAAKTEQTQVHAGSASEIRAALALAHGAELARVLRQCAVLVDGVRVDSAATIVSGSVVDVLPPFAGG